MALDMAYDPPDFVEFEPYHTPTPPPPPPPPPHTPPAETLKTALMTAAVVSFIFLISKDAHRAFTRRAHWIPCDFLVLSAFSIQLLNLLNAQNEALGSSATTGHWVVRTQGGGGGTGTPNSNLWQDFLTIHNSRTILCVFAAYVMPAMADRGLEHSWVRWVALVITVFHHVSSEFYVVKPNSDTPNFLRLWPQESTSRDPRYYVYATIISLCFIFLILLLACATIAGRSIERIVAKKICEVLRGEGEFRAGLADKIQGAHPHPHAHHHPHHHSCWRTVKSDIKEADHRYHPHHDHNDDRSCFEAVKVAVLRAGKRDESQHHSCWRTVEDALLRMGRREENHQPGWRTIQDAVARGEKAEEEHHRRHCHYCWRIVEDAVLKAWIIVRAYSIQPVIARSALTASAAIIVTIQIAITIVGGLAEQVKGLDKGERISFKLIAAILQSVFILIAWALINFRWATAVAYHGRSQNDSWRSRLRMEDFWTRHLRKSQEAREYRLPQAQSLDTKIERLVSKRRVSVVLPSYLLSVVIGLQWLLVSFSKACWLVSLMIFHNRLMGKLYSFMFEKHIMYVFEDYPKYRKILEEVQMLGETPENLWVANRKSIEKAKGLIIQGNQDGEYNCEDLVDFLSTKKTGYGLGLSCLHPYKSQTGLKFLCKKRQIQASQQPQGVSDVENRASRVPEGEPSVVEERFTDMSTKSWKMTAVSLLSIIVHLSPIYANVDKDHCSTSHVFPPGAVKDCLNAYYQAWEIIDFVEEADTEADEVTSEAADKYFHALKKKVDKADFPANKIWHATAECLRAALDELKQECRLKRKPPGNVDLAVKGKKEKEQGRSNGKKSNDSIDWQATASANAVYKLCDSIDCKDGSDVSELLKELESCLADIINECLEKTQHLLLLNSRKWALKRDEKRMGKALYAAGKAKAIMEKLEWNKVAIVSYH